MRKALLAFGILLLVFVADQVSKWLLVIGDGPEFGDLVLLPFARPVYGRGQADLLRGLWGSLGLLAVALRLIGGLTGWLRRTESRSTIVALGAVAGGVVSDVVDVVRARSVAGYAHTGIMRWSHHSWAVFNIADAAILCGAMVLLVEFWRRP